MQRIIRLWPRMIAADDSGIIIILVRVWLDGLSPQLCREQLAASGKQAEQAWQRGGRGALREQTVARAWLC